MMSKGLVMVMVMVLVLVLNLVFAQENLHFQGLIVTFHLVAWQKMLFEIKKVGNDSSLSYLLTLSLSNLLPESCCILIFQSPVSLLDKLLI